MNQRIKELAKSVQCERHWTEEDIEKFAELIVRECAGNAYEYDAPKMSGPGMIIAGRIETHFGVEP